MIHALAIIATLCLASFSLGFIACTIITHRRIIALALLGKQS